MAYLKRRHSSGMFGGDLRQDFSDDPLLPQKALPLPDDSNDYSVLLNGPADVVAAAASAMVACDSLPDAAAESVMQPLAEAYLLAVRREAQSLPNVVSAVSEGRREKQSSKSGTVASPNDTSVLSRAGRYTGSGSKFTYNLHPSDPSSAERAGKRETCQTPVSTATQSVSAFSVAKHFSSAQHAAQSANSQDFSDLPPTGEEVASISCSVASPSSASANSALDSEEETEIPGRCEAISVARSLNDLREWERNRSECVDGGGGEKLAEPFCKGSPRRVATDPTKSAQQRSALRGTRGSTEEAGNDTVSACAQGQGNMTGAHAGLEQLKRSAYLNHQQVDGVVYDDVPDSDVSILPQRDCAEAGAACDASHVGVPRGGLPAEGAREKRCGASADAGAAVLDCGTAVSCALRSEADAEKATKRTRQKVVAAYVDHLVRLDRQREEASASAIAPAAAWRETALRGFKRLRDYVNSDEFFLARYQQPEDSTGCTSWSEQEWQLYCRCYPPSLRLLASCDTVTVCKLLFLLVEDLKQQQRAVAKAQKRRSSGSVSRNISFGSGTRSEGEGTQHTQESDTGANAKGEQTESVCVTRAQQQRRKGDARHADDHDCTFQACTQQQPCGDEKGRNQGIGCGHKHDDQQDPAAFVQIQPPAEEVHAPFTRSSEQANGTITADLHTPVMSGAAGSKFGRHESTGSDAEGSAANVVCSEAACSCCKHRGCCVTLQQACWLFGVFVFLDELQAMDADVASCIQQLRRICENAREKARCRGSACKLRFPSASHAAEALTGTVEARKEDALLAEDKKLISWVPNDLVAALNLLIVVINDFFDQR